MNTVRDFLVSAEDLEADISCPSCGASMAAQLQGSYELVLSPRARNEFNNILSLYRGFLFDLEEQLRSHNLQGVTRPYDLPYPYEGDNQFGKPQGSGLFANDSVQSLRRYLAAFDRYDRTRLIGELPTRDEHIFSLDPEQNPIIRNILLGLEPNLIIGPLANVVLAQRHVASWIHNMSAAHSDGALNEILDKACPNIVAYLVNLQQNLQVSEESDETESEPSAPEAETKLNDETWPNDNTEPNDQTEPLPWARLIRRAKILLVLLLGHTVKDAVDKTQHFMRQGDPYRLPAEVQIHSRHLADVMVAAALLRRSRLGFSPEFRSAMSSQAFAGGVTAGYGTSNLMTEYGSEVAKVVNFACTGEPSQLPPEIREATGSKGAQRIKVEETLRDVGHGLTEWDVEGIKDLAEKLNMTTKDEGWSSGQVWFHATRPNRCGWFPKQAPTHGVILLGGPGVGKSTVMTTGLPTFVRSAFGLGLRIRFEDSDDNLMYGAYDDLYWKGILPKPTEAGVRHSIEFYAEQTAHPEARTHFVFTDIPGEIVAGGIQEPGTHPIIFNSLQHAKTIVFFFDPSLERDARETLIGVEPGPDYEALGASARATMLDRGLVEAPPKTAQGEPASPKGATKPQAAPSRAEVSQLGILNQLIEELRRIHGEDRPAPFPDVNLIVIIPKADIYSSMDLRSSADSQNSLLDDYFRNLRDSKMVNVSTYRVKANATDTGIPRDESLDFLRSSGATRASSAQAAGQTPAPETPSLVGAYVTQLRKISGFGRDALIALSKTEASRELQLVGEMLHRGLVETCESSFGKERVFFFPISAAGAGKTKELPPDEEGNKRGSEAAFTPPNQILSELVFMAPISLTLNAGGSRSDTSRPPQHLTMQPARRPQEV